MSGKYIKSEDKTYSAYIYIETSDLGTVIISSDKNAVSDKNLRTGNEISVYGLADEFSSARNYGNFDEKEYYHSLGISMRIKASTDNITVTNPHVSWIGFAAQIIKDKFTNSLEAISTESQIGFFTAILTGDKSELDDKLKTLFQENGIAHILAVSGLHVSLLGMCVLNFLKKRLGLIPAASISFAMVILYCVMCSWTASAVRALIMFIIRITAQLLGKTYDMLNALSLSVILLLLANPHYILNSGFRYSAAAIIAFIIFDLSVLKFLNLKNSWSKRIISTFVLTLVLTPISMMSYYYISAYALFLNLMILPLMSIILGSAAVGAAAGILSIFAGRFIIGIGSWSLSFIEALCLFIQKFPGSVITTGNPGLTKITVYYGLMAAFFVSMRIIYLKYPEKKDYFLRKAVFSIISAALIFIALFKTSLKEPMIVMLDVDQGECILIISPSGITYMIDAGSVGVSNVGEYRIKSALRYMGISKIDFAIVTHPDSDHVNGLLELIEDESAGRIFINNLLIPDFSGNDAYEALICVADEQGIDVVNASAGITLNDGVIKMACLNPDITYSSEDVNDLSAVFILEYDGFTALFTGDIGSETEDELINSGLLNNFPGGRNLSVLKVSHHGSKYSSSAYFLNYLKPSAAIISAGINNSYGHPAEEALKRIEDVCPDIFVTAENGEIKISAHADGSFDADLKF